MKKYHLSLVVALFSHLIVSAQDYNAVFPIQNSVTTGYPEYTAVKVNSSSEYLGKKAYMSNIVTLFKGNEKYTTMTIETIKYHTGRDLGAFISFNYVSKTEFDAGVAWNNSSEVTQFAFHPGGVNGKDADYNNSDVPYYVPLYAFTYSDSEGLNLIDLQNGDIIAKIAGANEVNQYVYLTVFAGNKRDSKDIIVVAGKNTFSIYGTFIDKNSNGIKAVEALPLSPRYFDVNGVQLNEPKQGLNIIVDGDTSKKVFIK